MNRDDQFIIEENWFPLTRAPIVWHHVSDVDGTGPSAWKSTVVLPRNPVTASPVAECLVPAPAVRLSLFARWMPGFSCRRGFAPAASIRAHACAAPLRFV
jgi:hypothetical protein